MSAILRGETAIEELETHERNDFSRFRSTSTSQVFPPSNQVGHLYLQCPFLPQTIRSQPISINEGFILPELCDELLKVCNSLGVEYSRLSVRVCSS